MIIVEPRFRAFKLLFSSRAFRLKVLWLKEEKKCKKAKKRAIRDINSSIFPMKGQQKFSNWIIKWHALNEREKKGEEEAKSKRNYWIIYEFSQKVIHRERAKHKKNEFGAELKFRRFFDFWVWVGFLLCIRKLSLIRHGEGETDEKSRSGWRLRLGGNIRRKLGQCEYKLSLN